MSNTVVNIPIMDFLMIYWIHKTAFRENSAEWSAIWYNVDYALYKGKKFAYKVMNKTLREHIKRASLLPVLNIEPNCYPVSSN